MYHLLFRLLQNEMVHKGMNLKKISFSIFEKLFIIQRNQV